MEFGTCKLCDQQRVLHEGHVYPAFAYKRYITGKGGRYFDSGKDRHVTRQRKQYMFCRECETLLTGRLDTFGANFLTHFEAEPYSPHNYDEQLLRWTVSL